MESNPLLSLICYQSVGLAVVNPSKVIEVQILQRPEVFIYQIVNQFFDSLKHLW